MAAGQRLELRTSRCDPAGVLWRRGVTTQEFLGVMQEVFGRHGVAPQEFLSLTDLTVWPCKSFWTSRRDTARSVGRHGVTSQVFLSLIM